MASAWCMPKRLAALGAAIRLLGMLFRLAGCAAAEAAPSSQPVEPAGEESLQARIALAIRQLGDAKYKVREEAMRFLWSVGRPAEGALRAALASNDPEVVRRARHVLEQLEYGILPDTPKELVALVEQYKAGNASAKQAALRKLLELGPAAHGVLLAMSASPDPQVRQEVSRFLQPQVAAIVPALLAAGKVSQAGEMLELGAAGGEESAVRNHAAFLLLRGGLEEKIRQLEAKALTGEAARALACYHRAAGDLNKAAAAAARSGDNDLLRQILFEVGDWKGLAEALSGADGPERIEQLGLLAACHRMTGQAEAFEKDLAEIRKLAAAAREASDASQPKASASCAAALLANDRPEEAIDVFIGAGQYGPAFELLCAQLRFAEAFALVEKAASADGEAPFALEAELVEALGRLGEKDKAEEIAVRLDRSAGKDLPALIRLLRAEVASGMEDQAFRRCATALAELKQEEDPSALLGAVLPGQGPRAGVWWRVLRRASLDEPPELTLTRLRELLAGRTSEQQLLALAQQAEAAAAELPRRQEAQWLEAVGEALHSAGLGEAALRFFERAGELSPTGSPWLRAGDLLARQGHWDRAAEACDQASRKAPAEALPLYLKGWALAHAGQQDPGQELMDLALLLPLASQHARTALAERLADRGLADAASRQRELAARAGGPGYGYFDWSWLQQLVERAVAAGDFSLAASHYERYRLQCLSPGTALASLKGHLILSARVNALAARGHLAAGRKTQVMESARRSVAAMPSDASAAIELISALDEAALKAEADELFAQAFSALEAVCLRYPRAATHFNNAAWLAAKCRRRLDRSLALASRAVELEPANAAYLDTLAEAHFQRGQRERAVELIKTCIRLEPKDDYLRRQLERFAGERPPSP